MASPICSWVRGPRDVVSGADPIGERPGFKAMLERIASNGVKTIIVESPDRFARDLAVQLAGHDYLRSLGVDLIPASAPDFFLADTPVAVLVRQVLGAISEFEKTSLVAKLKAARERKKATGVKVDGRLSHAEKRPEVVALAKQLRRKRPKGGQRSLREVAASRRWAISIRRVNQSRTCWKVKRILRCGAGLVRFKSNPGLARA